MSAANNDVPIPWDWIDKTADCWMWIGPQRKGYGYLFGRNAHRVIYERLVSDVPAGLELDHLCRNPLCVNPAHLEPVTHAENMARRVAATTHCVNGHERNATNSYRRPNGDWACRLCKRVRNATYFPPKSFAPECGRGHSLLDPENVYLNREKRYCRACRRLNRKRAAA